MTGDGGRALVAGEALVDMLPDAPGPLAGVERFDRRFGGAPANVAVGLARLDDPPLLWTRVGADPFGDFLADRLAAEGVATDLVERDGAALTGLAFVSLDADGERSFTLYREGSADTRLDPDRVPDLPLDGVDWVHVGGVLLADEPARSATLRLARRARRAGVTVSFDPNARPELWTDFDYGPSVRTMLGLVDVVKMSPADLRGAGFATDPGPAADGVLDAGPHTLLLTRGDEGTFAATTGPWPGSRRVRHPGYEVDAVDTTGAGDAFLSGAVAALRRGESLDEAVAFAGAVAALTTTARGAVEALPTRAAVEAFRAERGD
jgi:fructokinase